MPFCPNLSNPTVQKEFNSLVAKYGENKAYYLWDKYEGNIPKEKQTVGQNKKAVTQWFKSRFPNVDVFIKNTLENVGDAEALGYVEGAAVYLNEAAGVDTKYHEAFHLFFRTSLSDKQREQLYKDAEKSFGKPTPQDLKNAARGQENASKEDIYKLALEEKMAEATHEYGLTQEAPKNLSQRILKFIKDLWAFIKAVLGKPLTVRQAMRLIESNKIPSKFVRSAEAFAPGKAYLLKEFAQSVEQYENIVRVASAMVVDEYDAELKKLDLFEDAKTYNKQKAIMEKTIGKRLLGDPLDRKFSRSKIAEKILELSISYKGSRQEVSKEDFKEYRDLFEAVNQADESQIEEATLKLKQYMAEKEIQPIPPAFTAKGELISKQFHIDPTDLSIDEQKIEAKRLYSLGQHFRAVYKYWYDQTRNGKVVRGFRYDLIQTLKESGIKYVEKEKESTEFIDEVGEVERIYSVGRMEEDPGKKLSLRQRILLSRIPYESSEYSYTGLKSYVPATEVYKVLLNSVVNSENLDEMISKLRAEGKTKPHLSKIADFVNSLTAQEQAEFTRAMKMSANEFLSAKVVYTNTGESIQIFSPNLGSILKSKREEWRKASTSGVGLFRPRTSGIADVAGGFEINLEKQAKIYQLAIDAKIDPKTGLLQGLMNLDNQAAFAKLLMELGFKIAPTEEEAISRVRQVLSGSIPDLKDVKIGTFINDTTKLHKIISLVIGLSRQNQAPVLNDNFFSTEQSTVNNIIKTFVAPFETADASTFINNLSKSIYAINTRSRLSDAEIEIRTLNSETKQSKALDVLRNTLQHDQGKYKSLLFKLLSSRKYTKDFQFADFDSFTTLDGVIEVENFSKADILSIKLAAWNNRGNKEEGRIALDVHGDRQKFPTIPFPKLFKSDVLYDLGMQNESLEKILSDELMLDLNRMKKAQDDIIAFRSGDVGIDTLIEKYHYTVNDDGSLNFKKGNWRKFNSLNKEVEVDSNGLIADETLSRLVDGVAYAIKNQGDLLPSYSESFKSLLDESLGQMKANATEMVEFAKSLEVQYDDDFVGKNKEAYLTEWANYDYLGRMFARSLTRDGVNYTKNGKEFIKRAHHSSTPGMKGAIKGELSADRNYGMKLTHTVSSIQDVLVSLPEESRRLFKERLREKFNAPVLEELSLPDRYKTSLVAEGTLYLPDDVITVSISSIQDGLYEINGSSYYVSKEVVDGDITFKVKRYIDAADKIANQSYVDMESTDAQSFITLAWQKNIEEGDGRLGLKEQTAYEVYELTREWDPEIKIKAYKPYTDVRKNKNGLLVNYSFKTSYITLTPNLVKGIPILEDLLDRMEGKGVYEGMTPIDVVHTTSAQKLAIVPSKRVKTNTNEAQFFDLVTEEIDSSALRFPEDVPSKTNKRDTNLGRQTRINMLANINPNGLYTYNAGLDFAETVSGQELKNIYHRATATRVRRAMQQIYEELGYDKVLAATTLDEREAALKGMVPKMREALKELMSERDANVNENILDALEIGPDGETAVALGDPILQSRFDQLIASIFKNRVHKHKMKGMHAVQFADLGGIEIDESLQENLRFLEINGNRLAHAEVDISANYLMALGVSREQIKIAQDTGDMTHINEELRRIMGYRIPNQGKSSLIILKIRRILPDEFDGVIRVPPGITVMMGSDFDIDKMFVLFPEVETVDGEVRKVKVPYSELVNDLDKINTLSDKQISNIMFDTFEAVSSNLYHLDEVISPLDGPDLVDAQQKSRFYKPDTNIFSSSEAVTAFYENMLSHKLRGGWAIANAGRNILIGATLDPKLLESDLEIVVTDELNGEKVSMTNNRLTERTMFPDVINVPRPTDYAINLHIGAAVDSVKNPLQDSINDNEKTLNFRAYLYNRGLNVAQTTAILNHPFVRAMSDKAKADNVSLRSKMKFHKHEKLNVFLNLEGLNQKPANLDIGRINAASVDADQTLKRIAGILNKLKKSNTVKDFTKIELDTLKFLRDISFLVDESSRWYNLIKAANVFTIDKAGTIPQNLARMDMLDMYMIKDRDSDIYGGKALLSQILINPTVYESANAAYQALQDSLDVMTAGGFLVNQPALKRFRYFLSENSNNVAFNEVSQQQILSAVSHQIYTKPGSPFYEKGFLDKANIEQMHFQNENNIHSLLSQVETILSKNNISSPLVEALKPETKTFNGKALKFLDFNNTIKRTTSVENMIISSWEMLYFADEVFTEEADIEVLKKFAKALITNQILFSGFMPSRNAMWHLFPVRIQEELGTRNHFRNELKNLNNTRYLEETFGLDFFVNLNSFQTFTGQFLTKKEADSLHPALKSLPNKQTLVFSKSDSSRLYNVGSFIELIVFNPDGSSNSRLYQVEKEKSGEDTVLTFTALKTKGDFKFFELNIRDNDNNPLQESLLGSAGAEIGMITNGPVVPQNMPYHPIPTQEDIPNGYDYVHEGNDSIPEQVSDISSFNQDEFNERFNIPVQTDVSQEGEQKINTIPMQPDNVVKILSGEKTTTLRTNNLPSGVYIIGGKEFNITNRGLLSVEEAGGIEAITKSEAFAESGPKYSSTKEFLAGRRKLYVYDIKPTDTSGVNISSNSKGIAGALTNPTESAKSKGNIVNSYPIYYEWLDENGEARDANFKDVEEAYQMLKDSSEAVTKPDKANSKNYKLMVNLIATKLRQHPILTTEITKLGGSKWILSSTHQPTNKNTVWETGGQNWFIEALADAYNSIKPAEPYTKTSMSKLALGNKEDLTKARKKAQRLKNSFAAAGVKVNVVFGKLPDGVKGQVQGNVVTIDPSQMSDDTMYHEHAHILVDMLPESEVKGYIRQMYSLRPDIVAMVKKNYPELANDEFAIGKEVLVTAIGLEGANIERKNPSKLRILINRIMRAIGKLFGITPDAAVVLAEKLFVGDIQKLSLSKEFNPQIQLQRTLENKINDLFVDARSNLDIQIRNLKMKPETQQTNFDILKLKQLQGTLEKIKDNKRSVDGFFAFAEYVHNKTALLKAKMNDVKRLTKNGVNSKDAIQLLNTVEDIRNTIDTFYHTDKANSLIDKMRLMIREMMEENQFDDDTLAKEVLYNLVEATNTLGLMEQEYPEIVAPIVVDAIYSKGVSSINKKLDEVIDSVRKTQSTSGMNNNPQYQLLKKNKEQIMEEAKRNGLDPESEWKRRVVELKIETLQNKKLNRENLVAELTRAFKDKSGFSLYLDPIIYSSEANLQLFAKTLEESNFKAHKDQIALLRKSQPYYERFKAFKGSDTDKNAFYKDLFEVIEVPKNKDTIKVLALVQKYNVTVWDASRKKALESYLVDRPQYGTPAYDLWDLKKGNDYRREKAKWWGENSVPIANASQIYNGWLQDLATLKAQRDATSPNNVTEIGIYNQMIEDIQYKINSSFMPKYGVFTGQLAMPKDKDEFINPKYKTIEQTPQLKEMYTFLLNVYKEKQRPYGSSSPQHRNAWEDFSYVLPSIRQTNIESLQRKGALGLAKEVWQDGLQTVETDQDLYGAALDVEGNEYKHLPRMYTAAVDEKHITRDLLSSIFMFSYRSDQYKYKSELTGLVNAMINLHSQREMIQLDENGASLLSREAAKIKQKFSDLSGIDITAKTSADKSNTLNHLMQYIDVAFYGINKKKIKSKILGVDPNKFAAAINSLSAVGSLAFNTLQIGNQAIMDNLSQFQEAIAGQYFTAKNQAWGVKTFFASGAGIADIGSFAPKTKLGKVVMHFDALVGAMDSLSRDASGNKFLKAIQSGNLLAGQAAVEFQTSAVRMLALMDAMKGEFVDSKGEVITNTSGEPANLYDLMIETDEGVVLDPRVDTEKSGFDEADFRMKLRGLSKRTNQVKGNNDASTLSRTPLGSFLMLYKNYFIPGWRKRFGYGDTYHTDHETGEVIRGYYESTLDYFKLVAQNSGKFGAVYQMMSEVDKQNLRRAMVEASTILTTMIVFSALSAILDDDEEPPYAVAYFAYQARRLQTEMTSYINPFEAIRMFKAPMAAANFMGKWADLVNHIITVETPYTIATTFGIEPSEQLTKKAIYERDSYWGNEGDRKTIGKIGKVLPIIYGWSTVDAEVVEDKIRFFGG